MNVRRIRTNTACMVARMVRDRECQRIQTNANECNANDDAKAALRLAFEDSEWTTAKSGARGSNKHLSYHGAGSDYCFMLKTEAHNGEGPGYIWVADDNAEPDREDYGIEGGEPPSDEEDSDSDGASTAHPPHSPHSPRIHRAFTACTHILTHSMRIPSHSAQMTLR